MSNKIKTIKKNVCSRDKQDLFDISNSLFGNGVWAVCVLAKKPNVLNIYRKLRKSAEGLDVKNIREMIEWIINEIGEDVDKSSLDVVYNEGGKCFIGVTIEDNVFIPRGLVDYDEYIVEPIYEEDLND